MFKSLVVKILVAAALCVSSDARMGNLEWERKPSRSSSDKEQCGEGFEYPANLVPPPLIWVEGFASKLHAQNIQKYETPIQVWQTWRIDQLMWNCIAAYHPNALDAVTKAEPTYKGDPDHFDSETRSLCIMHGMNKLVPDLIPISADIIHSFLDEVGLCSDVLSDMDVAAAVEDGIKTPRIIGSLVAKNIIQNMQEDGFNYEGKRTKDGDCTANCR